MLSIPVDQVFPLRRAADAFALMERVGHYRGIASLVLTRAERRWLLPCCDTSFAQGPVRVIRDRCSLRIEL
jgi:hypothetical protein